MKHLRAVLRIVGPFGIAAIGLLLACLSFYFSAVEPAENELALQHQAAQQGTAQRLKSRTPHQNVALDGKGEHLQRFHSLFPQITLLPDETEKLWAIAAQFQIDLQQGEYRLEADGPGLVRYRVALPLRASYPRLRQFVNVILKEIPTVSIDGLRFERKKISETQLDAQIRLTFYFRPSTQALTPQKAP